MINEFAKEMIYHSRAIIEFENFLTTLKDVSVDYLLDDDISEITLSDKSTAQKSEHYLLTHFHRLSNSSKKELLNFLQYLEQRDESARSKSAL